MDNLHDIIKRIEDHTQPPPTPLEILKCLEKHPYFSTLAVAWLKRTSEDGMLFDASTRNRIALYAAIATPGDTKTIQFKLADLSTGLPTDDDFYPQSSMQHQPDTEETIDTFLSEYSSSESNKEIDVIEQMIFNPVADYASILEEEERHSIPKEGEAAAGSDEDIINRFIIKNRGNETIANTDSRQSITPPPVPERKYIKKPASSNDESTFSESLAKIYLHRKNYAGAHEIINKLNLKFPEKNIYFAVQLRFLEKLLLNESLKKDPKISFTNNKEY